MISAPVAAPVASAPTAGSSHSAPTSTSIASNGSATSNTNITRNPKNTEAILVGAIVAPLLLAALVTCLWWWKSKSTGNKTLDTAALPEQLPTTTSISYRSGGGPGIEDSEPLSDDEEGPRGSS